MIRFIGGCFLFLSFLAGITIGTLEIALINTVLFLGLALIVLRFVPERWGQQGVVYGMAGAFFASLLWPFALILTLQGEDGEGCQGDECLKEEVLRVPQ